MAKNPFIEIVYKSQISKKKLQPQNNIIKTKIILCPNCGVSLPEASSSATCNYCGYRFMKIIKKHVSEI